jgi:murein L,D-transpeptidase YcbB/YkuD
MLKAKGTYTGDATGKLDDPTRESIKVFQKGNGLRETGTLNRATLEKMGIELTDKQKLIPASPNSYASSDAKTLTSASTAPGAEKPKKTNFLANKDQISDAQKLMKGKAMYSGDETGKLDDATRESLKKYQQANGLKVTGTLNRATLEKMGIELTDKQKSNP